MVLDTDLRYLVTESGQGVGLGNLEVVEFRQTGKALWARFGPQGLRVGGTFGNEVPRDAFLTGSAHGATRRGHVHEGNSALDETEHRRLAVRGREVIQDDWGLGSVLVAFPVNSDGVETKVAEGVGEAGVAKTDLERNWPGGVRTHRRLPRGGQGARDVGFGNFREEVSCVASGALA